MTSASPQTLLGRLLAPFAERATRTKAMKFAMIGVINTGVDYALFAVAYLYFGFPVIGANALAWIVANTGSYVLNSFFTFAAESGRQLRLKDYLGFVASGVAGFIANTTTVVVLSYFIPVLVAKAFAIGVSFLVNFALSHFVVFPAHRARAGEKRE